MKAERVPFSDRLCALPAALSLWVQGAAGADAAAWSVECHEMQGSACGGRRLCWVVGSALNTVSMQSFFGERLCVWIVTLRFGGYVGVQRSMYGH